MILPAASMAPSSGQQYNNNTACTCVYFCWMKILPSLATLVYVLQCHDKYLVDYTVFSPGAYEPPETGLHRINSLWISFIG